MQQIDFQSSAGEGGGRWLLRVCGGVSVLVANAVLILITTDANCANQIERNCVSCIYHGWFWISILIGLKKHARSD